MIPDRSDRQRRVVSAAAAVTVLLGLAFVFIRAPHPFGWEGIDHYDDLARRLARGEPFPTTDVPWGYAYFLAAFYRLAGDRPWVPLVAQVLLNGLVPPLLYRAVKPDLGGRAATLAALLVSVFSFNTVYASTQSSDSVCTVIFLAGLAAFVAAVRSDSVGLFAASGLLAGLASQFRPNLILLPAVLAAVALATNGRTARRLAALLVYVAVAASVSIPWIVRNYRLTGELIPTSTHGGVQWWYGTLQTGPYLDSRAHNPRSMFEASAFEYTSLAGRPLIVAASRPCEDEARAELRFWTDRDRTPQAARRLADVDAGSIQFEVPPQSNRTAVYFYFAIPRADGGTTQTPPRGQDDPFVVFVDDRHLEDLDRHDDLLDVFDVIRTMRAIAFGETADRRLLDLTEDGKVDEDDLRELVGRLLNGGDSAGGRAPLVGMSADGAALTARFVDGSTFTMPRAWSGRITDVNVTAGLAARLLYERQSIGSTRSDVAGDTCRTLERVRVNDVFYLREPHLQRRYAALAWDNIGRDPAAYAAACAYRAVRLFVVQGTSDASTAWQFAGSGVVYAVATLASIAYVVLAAAGAAIAVRRGRRISLLLTPIVYIPATICFVLTNMRYTITVQPLLFAFGAVAITALARDAAPSGRQTTSRPS